MDKLNDQRAALGPGMLPSVAALLEQFDEWMPLAQVGLRGAGLAPTLLGHDGPRTYLVLAQNSDELRVTGGFISAAGSVRLENGRITELRVGDSYALDNLAQPHPPAPAALAEQMGAQMLVLRDSNWSPDYPTSAAEARGLYLQDQGVVTDGAIAIDLEAIRLLVGALAPLEVPGFPPLTAENVLPEMKRAWATPANTTAAIGSGEWWKQRKDFMAPLLAAALARLQGEASWTLPGSGRRSRRCCGRSIFRSPWTTRKPQRSWLNLVGMGACGSHRMSDFVAIVDSNVGFNKANASVRQEVTYEAANGGDGVTATLSITYIHRATAGEERCDRTPRYSDTYEGMERRCYWDYLRVFLPPGSSLLAGEGLDNAHTEIGNRNMTVVAGSFVLPVGGRHIVRLRYALPQTVPAAPYRLLVRSQAGAAPFSAVVRGGACEWQGPVVGDLAFSCPSLEKR